MKTWEERAQVNPQADRLWFGYQKRPHSHVPAMVAGDKDSQLLLADGTDSHVLVVAPTGSGKSRNLLIPNLLQCTSSVVVIDIKGELAMTTARYRREVLGHKVVVLDPFHRTGDAQDSLNPLDCILLQPGQLADNALALSETITGDERGHKEPFWDLLANDLVAALIALAVTNPDPQQRHLGVVWDLLVEHDTDIRIAQVLDQRKDLDRFVANHLASYLKHEGEKVRTSILSTARQHVRIFSSPQVQNTVRTTSFDLKAFRDGGPTTIYLVLPPQRLHSHAAILRLWLSALLGLLMDRTSIPAQPTLFLVDEMAQLGAMPLVMQAVSLMRGYGLRCMLMLQSLNQVNAQSRDVLIDNCGVLATFGSLRYHQAASLAHVMGDVTPETLVKLPSDQIVINRPGTGTTMARKLDYLHDPLFAGRFDPNPYYASSQTRGPRLVDGP